MTFQVVESKLMNDAQHNRAFLNDSNNNKEDGCPPQYNLRTVESQMQEQERNIV
jgi:hypothetical protein